MQDTPPALDGVIVVVLSSRMFGTPPDVPRQHDISNASAMTAARAVRSYHTSIPTRRTAEQSGAKINY